MALTSLFVFRYFGDDDSRDLRSLVLQQRHGGVGGDMDENTAHAIMRNAGFKALPTPDEEYDHDMGLNLVERKGSGCVGGGGDGRGWEEWGG